MPTFIETARKEQIIEATLALINEKGNAGISIGDISRKTGISKGNIAYYFKTKDEIIRHVLIRIVEQTGANITPKVEKKKSCRAQISTYVSVLLKYWIKQRHGYECMIQLVYDLSRSEEKMKFNTNMLRGTVGFIHGLLEKGNQAGEFSINDTKETALMIHALIDGVLLYWIMDDRLCNYNKAIKMVENYVDSLLESK